MATVFFFFSTHHHQQDRRFFMNSIPILQPLGRLLMKGVYDIPGT